MGVNKIKFISKVILLCKPSDKRLGLNLSTGIDAKMDWAGLSKTEFLKTFPDSQPIISRCREEGRPQWLLEVAEQMRWSGCGST